MTTQDYSNRYCIVGGGASGITTAKNLLEHSIPFDLIEQEDEFGGNWYYNKPCSSIYKSVHMISSRRFSAYTDFPIPDDCPTYLRADQALDYLRRYARHFGVHEHAEFGCSVLEIVPVAGTELWDVGLDRGETRRYRGVFVANGHLVKPNLPAYPGHFNGVQLHSSQYKTPEVLAGKRVLVVGAGNSGCDIAVEAVHHGAAVFHSTHRGYYYWPKFLFGMPADEWAEWPLRLRLPLWCRRLFGEHVLRMFTSGKPEDYGLPKPDHKLFEVHFIINTNLFYHLAHGDIVAKRDVRELRGDRVAFADGTEEMIDAIVYATGFHPCFHFIDQQYLSWPKERPQLYMNIFDPQHQNLFFIGLFQTSTGNWPLMDYQAQLVARYIKAREFAPKKAARLTRLIASDRTKTNGGIHFTKVSRHAIEVEHFSYRSKIRGLIASLPASRREARELPLRPAVLSLSSGVGGRRS